MVRVRMVTKVDENDFLDVNLHLGKSLEELKRKILVVKLNLQKKEYFFFANRFPSLGIFVHKKVGN